MPAPKIDYQLTPVDHGTRSAQIALIEVGRKRIAHAFKPDLTGSMYLSHSDTVTVLLSSQAATRRSLHGDTPLKLSEDCPRESSCT